MDPLPPRLAAIPFPEINPVIVSIGPVSVHWYGLAYVAGILIGWLYARRLVGDDRLWRHGQSRPNAADLDDFLIWAAAGIVIGGRLGYVLFYDLGRVIADPLRAIEIWNGGMSFHGGLIGTTFAMVLFAMRRGLPVWTLFDIIAAVAPIGLFFGRIANFINGELWGRMSDVPWAMVFPTGGPFPRHPTQLYEAALEGVVLFLALRVMTHRGDAFRRPGLVAGAFVAGYALARIAVEFFREPDAHIGYLAGGWLTMGMVLSLPMLAVGLWAMARARAAAPAPRRRAQSQDR